MEKKIVIAAVLVALAAIVLGVGFYMLTEERDQEASLDEVQENLKAEPEEAAQKEPANATGHQENRADEHDAEAQRRAMRAAEANTMPSNQAAPSQDDAQAPRGQTQDEVIKQQVPRLYEDLFKELALPEERRKKVEDHLVNAMKTEADFGLKLLDPNVSVEEVLREQDRFARQQQGDLSGVLSAQEQDVVKKHQNDLPKKMQKDQIMMLVERLNLDGREKENVKNTIERAVQNNESKKRLGQYTAQDVADLRKQFGGAKPGDPEFMRATIEVSANEVKTLLKDLEQLPKEQYEAIKQQMEMPLEMMRQSLKQRSNQGAQRHE